MNCDLTDPFSTAAGEDTAERPWNSRMLSVLGMPPRAEQRPEAVPINSETLGVWQPALGARSPDPVRVLIRSIGFHPSRSASPSAMALERARGERIHHGTVNET